MWAYATFGYKPTPESLIDELEAAALRILPTFSCQNISNTMWCVRGLLPLSAPLRSAPLEHLLPLGGFHWRNGHLTTCDICTCLQAMPARWAAHALEHVADRCSTGRRAFAKLEHACPELLDAAMRHVMRLTHEYTPQSDANMLWCEPCNPHLDSVKASKPFRHIADLPSSDPLHLLPCIPAPQHLCNTSVACRACATIKHPPSGAFLDVVLGHAMRSLQDFTPQNLANTVWAIATLGLPAAKCMVRS